MPQRKPLNLHELHAFNGTRWEGDFTYDEDDDSFIAREGEVRMYSSSGDARMHAFIDECGGTITVNADCISSTALNERRLVLRKERRAALRLVRAAKAGLALTNKGRRTRWEMNGHELHIDTLGWLLRNGYVEYDWTIKGTWLTVKATKKKGVPP